MKLSACQIVFQILQDYAAQDDRCEDFPFKIDEMGIDQLVTIGDVFPDPYLLITEIKGKNGLAVSTGSCTETVVAVIVLGNDRATVDRACESAVIEAVKKLDEMVDDEDSIVVGSTDPEEIINETVPLKKDDEISQHYPHRSQRAFTVFTE